MENLKHIVETGIRNAVFLVNRNMYVFKSNSKGEKKTLEGELSGLFS